MAGDYRGTEVFGKQPGASKRQRSQGKPPRRPRGYPRPDDQDDASRHPGPALGIVSVALAAVTMVVVGIGVTTSLRGDYSAGTTLAYVSTGMSIVAVLGGLSAVLTGRGRGWGLVAIVLGLVTNPLLLTKILGWASGLG